MISRTLAAIGGGLALAGCGLVSPSSTDSSLSSRCADVMRQAMPNAEIEIAAMKSAADQTQDLNTIRATAEGSVVQGEKPVPVAMECVFHEGVLVSIRWLAGPEAAK